MSAMMFVVAIVFWLIATPLAALDADGDHPHHASHRSHSSNDHRSANGDQSRRDDRNSGGASQSTPPSDECLVEIHDETGALPDGETLCQTATDHVCTVNLQLCLNQPQEGCTPANFSDHTVRATGHCAAGQLRVDPMGTGSVCGAFTGVKVHTRSSGKRPGRCTVRVAARSAKVKARTDVDTVTLVCMPRGVSCSSTTTTTRVATTTTTAAATTTTTAAPPTTTTAAPTTTTTIVVSTTTTAAVTTTTTAAAPTTTTAAAGTTTTTPTSTTTTTTAGTVIKGALIATPGRFNFNMTLGLPGANAACNTNFPGSHVCTLAELQSAPATALVGLKDTSNMTVTSFWAVNPAADPVTAQCCDDVNFNPCTSANNWEYGTAHTLSRGQKVSLNNTTGALGSLETGVQCNFAPNNWLGCCQ